MKIGMKLVLVILIFLTIIIWGCGSSPSVPANSGSSSSVPDELDLAIRDASDYLNDNIPKGSMIVILNVQSDSASLSDYVIDELIANAVNDKIFKVVDRRQLDLIRAEQNFQLSGEVDDKLAVSIGKVFGAQTIVSGKVVQVGERYRMTIRALEVQTAQVQGQYNRNIVAGKTITALMKNGGSVRGTQSSSTVTTGNGTSSTVGTATQIFPNVPDGTIVLNVNSVADWNTAINKIRNGGNDQSYVINVTGNISVPAPPNNENIFGSVTGITVIIQGNGTVSLSAKGSLLRIGIGQLIIVRNTKLRGCSSNDYELIRIMNGGIFRMEGSASVMGNTYVGNGLGSRNHFGGGVRVEGGTFIMQDKASVTGNSAGGGYTIGGGGVYVNRGTFIMHDGTISGNTSYCWDGGGGVYIGDGTFTMHGGTISGNTARDGGINGVGGGGVCVAGGTFIMQNGTISRNTVIEENGGGVYVSRGTFTMQGGEISGNIASGKNYAYGGGVTIRGGTFTKTGGTINGSDTSLGIKNTADKQGQALYFIYGYNSDRWRNTTAGPDDKTDGYGFWLND